MGRHAVAVTTPNDTDVVITRSFDAPRALVWDAMTKREFLERWCIGPPGWRMSECRDDLRVGGTFTWAWTNEAGVSFSMSGVYRVVEPPRADGGGGRVVRTESFDMAEMMGTECGGPMPEQLSTLEFTERAGVTTVKVTLHYGSKQARDGAVASGMTSGMEIGYARLDEIFAERLAAPSSTARARS